MSPLQAKSPLLLVIVHPVAETPPANSTLPVDVPAIWTKPLVPASSVRLVVAPVVIAPVPAKPKEVADTAMVSIEATPVSAPPVVTLRPVDETWKVPVALPTAVFADPDVLIFAVPTILVEPVKFKVSKADPILRVSALVLSVAILSMFPPEPDPIFTVFALLPVARLTVPVVPESRFSAPVPLELTLRALFTADDEIVGLLPEKVSAVDVNVLVLTVPSTVRVPLALILPSVEILTPVDPYPPPTFNLLKAAAPAPVTLQLASFKAKSETVALPMVIVPVDEPVPIVVLKFEESLRDTAAPVTVNPACPVRSPADVIVPVPDV